MRFHTGSGWSFLGLSFLVFSCEEIWVLKWSNPLSWSISTPPWSQCPPLTFLHPSHIPARLVLFIFQSTKDVVKSFLFLLLDLVCGTPLPALLMTRMPGSAQPAMSLPVRSPCSQQSPRSHVLWPFPLHQWSAGNKGRKGDFVGEYSMLTMTVLSLA